MAVDIVTQAPLTGTSALDVGYSTGPLVGVDNTNGGLYLNTANNTVWNYIGPGAFISGLIGSAVVVNTAANLFTPVNLPAGFLNQVGKSCIITCNAVYVNSSGAPTVAVTLKLGSTSAATWTSGAVTNGATLPINIQVQLTTQTTGGSGTVQVHGSMTMPLTSQSAAASTYMDQNGNTAISLNLTSSLGVTLNAVSLGNGNSIQVLNFTFEPLN